MIMETLARFTETFQVAEIDLIYKTGFNVTERPKITQAADAYELLLKNWNQGRLGFVEEFKILLLNQGNFVLGEYQVSQGGVSHISRHTTYFCRCPESKRIRTNPCSQPPIRTAISV